VEQILFLSTLIKPLSLLLQSAILEVMITSDMFDQKQKRLAHRVEKSLNDLIHITVLNRYSKQCCRKNKVRKS